MASTNETSKALVNKPENFYNFVKLFNLKIKQKYEIFFFKFIKTKYEEKLVIS